MRALAPDEKCVMVMAYTPTMLVRGGLIVGERVRVSTWLRNQGISNFLHLADPQALIVGSGAPKSITYSEIYVPTTEIMAFHIAPPISDPFDFDTTELNRTILSVNALAGTFVIKGQMRISSQSDFGQSLDTVRTPWLSVYEAEVTNPYIAQFNIQVPMLLVSANMVSFGV